MYVRSAASAKADRFVVAVVAAVAISGCNDAGRDLVNPERAALSQIEPVEVCDAMFDGDDVAIEFDFTACPNCTAENVEAATDGSFDSVMTIRFGGEGSSGSFSVRLLQQSGDLVSTGFAGVFRGQPVGSTGFVGVSSYTQQVLTLRDGLVQETSGMGTSGPFVGDYPEKFALQGFVPIQPYNGIEYQYTWEGARAPLQLRISEFCKASRAFVPGIPVPARAGVAATKTAPPGADGKVEIDLLVLYSPRYGEEIGGDVRASLESERLVNEANQFFDNSAIPVRYRLVDAALYTGVSETLETGDELSVLQADPAVQIYRDSVKADLVALLVVNDLGFDLCGKAGGFNGNQQSESADNVDSIADSFIVAGMGGGTFGFPCGDVTFAHELGHTLGAGHEIESGAVASYWKPYAHAYTCGTTSDGATIPTIMFSSASAGSEYFSNPDIVRDGNACGSRGIDGAEATQADNARVIREAAPFVAAYR